MGDIQMCVFKIIFADIVFQDVCKGESAAAFFLWCVFLDVMLLTSRWAHHDTELKTTWKHMFDKHKSKYLWQKFSD